ncbi:MAG: ATP-binding protein, partial [Thermodesulfobacteriota bacterium]|nr:ATP-binding protein [Thermodesulfobacteriota bacterium]
NLAIRGRLETKDLVSVTFTDDGCGIPNSDLKQVFEPFFSTKAKIGGTGLGLSITYGLVQEIGSDISVESEVGKGTSFTVTIPLTIKTATGENDAGNTC